jgi:hypothetical protein
MNSFEFQFSPILPSWLLIIIFLLGSVLIFRMYKNETVSFSMRWVLQSLRFLSLLILFLLLLQPIFITHEFIDDLPKVAILLDNSESTGIKNGRYKGLESYKEVLSSVFDWDTTKAKLDIFSFGITQQAIQTMDSLRFNQKETDLYTAIDNILQNEDEYDAAVILSDGNYTINRDPIFTAELSPFPFYTIALGDTIPVKDIILKSVNPPAMAYSGTPFSLPFRIVRSGFSEKQTVSLVLSKNNKVIQRKKISFKNDETILNDSLAITSTELGLNRWKLELEKNEDEFTTKNNSISFTSRIIENKTRIAHLSFAIHPDVKILRTILAQTENTELITGTWISGNNFIENLGSNLADSVQLFILHGFPNSKMPQALIDKVLDWAQQKSTIWLTLPNQDQFPDFALSNQILPVTLNQQIPFTNSELLFNETEKNHPILDLADLLPSGITIKAKQRSAQTNVKAKTLISISYRGIDLAQPAVATLQNQTKRYAQFTFFDWFKMYLNGGKNKEFIEKLIKNTVEWTIASPIQKQLELTLPDRELQENETFAITARLKNESLLPIKDATIRVRVKQGKSLVNSFVLNSGGDGTYSKIIGPFTEGLFRVEAEALLGETKIDEDKGTFSVSAISNEYRVIDRNNQLLANISIATGGETIDFNEAKTFLKNLSSDLSEKGKKTELEKETALIDHYQWLLLLTILLTLEWGIRKKLALR